MEGDILKGSVVSIGTTSEQSIAGTDTFAKVQSVVVRLQDGTEVTLENDYFPVRVGDGVFLNKTELYEGGFAYGIRDIDRLPVLWGLLGLFIITVVFFARWSGVRALLSVGVSLLCIIYILFPLLLAGYSPAVVSFCISSLILSVAILGTHGFTKVSYSALLSTLLSVAVSGTLAWIVLVLGRFTGFAGEEAVYLNFSTHGNLDFTGLLLGAIIIGMLGVLDDIAITQASLVEELHSAMPSASRKELYARAIKVGRHHVEALINTLFLAYTGAALPLLLLLQTSTGSLSYLINQEMIAVEMVRTMVGSLGLILAVPFSTWLAVRMFTGTSK